jgi:EAL domain-containing protein (putative c-di-GMP-specific phosphodiesterase class I)/GGDEF domain-containing protein
MARSKNKAMLMIDDKALRAQVTKLLRRLRCSATPGRPDTLESVFDEVPHLLIIDEDFHEGQGRKIAHALKEDMVLRYIPILLLAADSVFYVSRESEMIDAYVPKAKVQESLLPRVRAILEQNQHELDLNPLTSLPGNRSSMLRIERAIRSKDPFAVCCVDLGNLAVFNKAYGDARGDEVIIRLAHIIRDALQYQGAADDFIGHLGGDDLVVMTRPGVAETLSETIIQNFDAIIPSFYDTHDREQGYLVQRNKEGALAQFPIMSVSIAIVHNERRPRYRLPQISRIAGELKKYMKALPGSCYIQYRRKGRLKTDSRDSLEVRFPSKMKSINITEFSDDSDRHSAFFKALLKSKNIRTLYQPIVDLRNKRIVGYEALTRALSDTPTEEAAFLFASAREAGMVKELDELCVETALKTGQAMGHDRKLFLNLNHETLIDAKIMKRLFSMRGAIGFKNIVVEMTEQSILRSFDKVRDALMELKEKGVSFAIDDVGGGAVSLRDVAALKPDYIKFDRSLIRQIDISTTKQQIVLSMILFAKGIRAQTTAEGIETREEYEAVRMCGVDLGQGYYFAKPGPLIHKLPS